MQAVHEFGHVLGAFLTGGEVERVVLHPLAISRTDLRLNPHPLTVIWAGPVIGILLPIAAYVIAFLLRWSGEFLLRFFAGFCLIANGAYLAGGSVGGIGDAGDLLREGAAIWQLWLFGLLAIPAGLAAWNGLGMHFGFGAEPRDVAPSLSYGCLVVLVSIVVIELIIS